MQIKLLAVWLTSKIMKALSGIKTNNEDATYETYSELLQTVTKSRLIDPLIILFHKKQILKVNDVFQLLNNAGVKDTLTQTLLIVRQLLLINKSIISINFNCGMETLDDGWIHVGIGDKGCVELATILAVNTTIKHIDLRFNTIGDEGALYLAQALMKNSTVHQINLANNQISESGLHGLIELLMSNQTLQELNLSNNIINDKTINSLIKALNTNYEMALVFLGSYNTAGLSPEILTALIDTFADKPIRYFMRHTKMLSLLPTMAPEMTLLNKEDNVSQIIKAWNKQMACNSAFFAQKKDFKPKFLSLFELTAAFIHQNLADHVKAEHQRLPHEIQTYLGINL